MNGSSFIVQRSSFIVCRAGLSPLPQEEKMKYPKNILMLIMLMIVTFPLSSHAGKLRFGTLGVIQALPLYVAAEKGFFSNRGIEVELVNFNSAMEKDMALTAGQISGYFGDLMTPIVLRANATPLRIVATLFNTTGAQRMFAILAPPGGPQKTLAQVAKDGIAGSSNTIIEYITVRILEGQKIPVDSLNMIEVKNIPIRLQILLTGQASGVALPEPLVTLAEMKGARVLADDAGKGISSTILAFLDHTLKESPKTVQSFLAGVSEASAFISKHPEEVRPIMNRYCQVPEPLHQRFAIPQFPKPTVPSLTHVMDVYQWLRQKGIIKTEMTYKQMVADGYLP
jgi:NitT/TauT family transport system substrate-binding protein